MTEFVITEFGYNWLRVYLVFSLVKSLGSAYKTELVFFTIDGIMNFGESEWRISPDHANAFLHQRLLNQFVLGQSFTDAKMSLQHVRRLKM